jgi:hypothetical protein
VSLTLVALVFWGWVLGMIGAVLAVPLTLFAKALLVDVDPQLRWADAFLGSTKTAQLSAAAPDTAPDDAPPTVDPSGADTPAKTDGPSASGTGSAMMNVSPRE